MRNGKKLQDSREKNAAPEPVSARDKWEERYAPDEYIHGKAPVPFLVEKIGILPRGQALCLAAGEGRNAVYLAQQGYEVTAIDISARAVEKCHGLARECGVQVRALAADLLEVDLGVEQYDLVTNFFFCERALFPRIARALKPGGMFVLQSFSIDQLQFEFGPHNPAFLLQPNELLEHFKDCRIRYYEDAVITMEREGECREGAVIRMIAEKQAG